MTSFHSTIKTLSIDIETYSSVDLRGCGVYKYAESKDFEILLFAYSINEGEVEVVDIASGEEIPEYLAKAIKDDKIIKWAYNAQFERVCLSKYFGVILNPISWRCSMIWSAYLGLPLPLAGVSKVLALKEGKLDEGKNLIRYFTKPCAPTKVNGGRTRNLPGHDKEKWETFKAYNKRDVEVELAVKEKLKQFPVPDSEWQLYFLDQKINDLGIRVDMEFVRCSIACNSEFRWGRIVRAQEITGLDNPNSVSQLMGWLRENGLEVESLSKNYIQELIERADGEIEEALRIRQELAKSSIRKYAVMEKAACKDKSVKGLFQFYGANRTGRWAGRLLQAHNLPGNHLPDLDQARNLVSEEAVEVIDMLYESVPIVLSQLIRTALVPRGDGQFLVADFSAIEARVIAWLAGEKWRMDVFETHGKIYEASASRMFKVPLEEITKGSVLRQKGKIAELALGYGGSVGALKAMGALSMGLSEEELRPLVDAWRKANPNIVKLWWDVDKAAVTAVKDRMKVKLGRISFSVEKSIFFITLPSGRRLSYIKPRIIKNQYFKDTVTYEGAGTSRKWERIESYGPKCAENIVQAIARDILAEAMLKVDAAGFQIVLHVHDEIVAEANDDSRLPELIALMSETPRWAEGLKLSADGYSCRYYKKD
jgi:DNA polymerase